MRRVLFASLLLSAGVWPGDSLAEPPPTPVHVTVVGQGSIKVRIAAGAAAPCDASSNEPLLEGTLRAGDTRELSSLRHSVCVQHTYGGFRDALWSNAVIVTPRCARWAGRRCLEAERFIRLDLSTAEPFLPR